MNGYVRHTLWTRQNYKCCFCELLEQHEYNDVEHYRPKAELTRTEGGLKLPGYWWLAWTWANLMFACQSCNRTYKKTLFPLDTGSVPLRSSQRPPGREKPLLIDPFQEDPIEHIQFRSTRIDRRLFWLPFPRNGSKKGFWTIKIAGLGRDTLRDLYQRHVVTHVAPRLELIRTALATGDPQVIAATWRRETGALLDHRQVFVALSYDVLDAAFPETIRTQHDLDLTRP